MTTSCSTIDEFADHDLRPDLRVRMHSRRGCYRSRRINGHKFV